MKASLEDQSSSNTNYTQNANQYLNLHSHNNPFRLDTGNNPAIILVTDLLTSDNYATWSRAMRRALRAKNKLAFIIGTISQPTDQEDPLFDLFERCNDMMVSWLQNSISNSIRSGIAFVDSARDVWLDLQDRFSHRNGPRIYQLRKSLANLSQETDPVSVYYGKLKTFWDETLIYDPIPSCSCGTMKTISERYQRDCVFQFLMGLNDSYSPIRDQIMLLDPIPTIARVFSIIQQQERQHQLTSNSTQYDAMAFAIRKPSSFTTKFPSHSKYKKERTYCTHCKITRHTLETCFKVGNTEAPICTLQLHWPHSRKMLQVEWLPSWPQIIH
jgi:hypothetical protein